MRTIVTAETGPKGGPPPRPAMRLGSKIVREQLHQHPTAAGRLGRLGIWAIFLLRFLPARNAHCALCALRFAWESTARHHCSCPLCNETGPVKIVRGGNTEPYELRQPVDYAKSVMHCA